MELRVACVACVVCVYLGFANGRKKMKPTFAEMLSVQYSKLMKCLLSFCLASLTFTSIIKVFIYEDKNLIELYALLSVGVKLKFLLEAV
jgi:hypothetical protein